jgi:hypothetical protein
MANHIAFEKRYLEPILPELERVGIHPIPLNVNRAAYLSVSLVQVQRVCQLLGFEYSNQYVMANPSQYEGIFLAALTSFGQNAMERTAMARAQERLRSRETQQPIRAAIVGGRRSSRREAPSATPTVSTPPAAAKKKLAESTPADLQRYVALFGPEKHDTAKQKAEACRKKVDLAQQELIAAIRAVTKVENELAMIAGTQASKELAEEFKKMCAAPEIERIVVQGTSILVSTRTIEIAHAGKVYDIGKFKLELRTNGEGGCVDMINLTRKVDGMFYKQCDHPHVYMAKPCLGNITQALPHIIAERKYPAAVSLCMQFLKSYTAEEGANPYCKIDNWPVKRS